MTYFEVQDDKRDPRKTGGQVKTKSQFPNRLPDLQASLSV